MHRVVPELIVENFRKNEMSGQFSAVGMFLDLSGFSTMTDSLMQHGQHGAEVLAGLMHSVFDPLVRSIFNHGGKIVSFQGDGIMALYPIEGDEKSTALRALSSAWFVQEQLLNNPGRSTEYGKFPLSVKIGLATGKVSWKILRSDDDRQAIYYFRGSAVESSAKAEHQAGARNIVLMPEMNELVKDEIHTQPHDGLYRFIRFRLKTPDPISYTLSPIDLDISRRFMPEDVIVHDIRGEFRQIVNLFLRIPELPDKDLEYFINKVFELRQQYGGLLSRLDFGDKGCNMLVLWGAPVAYENDIGRALNFVIDLQDRTGFPITAGVTYYIAHAGYLGSEMCEDYTCYGWGVNLASRFMMSAPTGRIWVDERVAQRVSQQFDVEQLGAQFFKGFAVEQKVYLLRGRKPNFDVTYQGEMVGREEELRKLEEFVAPLWDGKFAGVLSVTGDAGIGKGRLIHAFNSSNLFREHHALWATCQTDQILRSSFNPFRKWLLRYFGMLPTQTLDERRQAFDIKLNDLLASVPDLELASDLDRTRSVLAAMVDVTWDDSLYSQLDAEGRYNNTLLALVALIKAESLRQPVILYVDDVHFIDPDSKVLLSRLKRSLSASSESHPVAILLVYRKQGDTPPIQDDISGNEIELSGILHSDLSHLAEILLGGSASPGLLELIMSRSEGNPYFAEQVIRYLQEERMLEISSDGWRQVSRGRSTLLPGDIRALLVARLDQLKQEVKNIVQTASVLGREFEVRALMQMLDDGRDTMHYVSEAEKAAIWAPIQEIRYIFHHGLLRDAAYTMQMRARRKELHALALDALETLYRDDPGNRYAELAYHAEHGDLLPKAQLYYTKAGKIASESYQNELAVDYFTRALTYTPINDLTTQCDLVVGRSELFSRMGRRELELKDLDSMETWANQLNDTNRLTKALMLRIRYFYTIGNYLDAIECAERASLYINEDIEPKVMITTRIHWASTLLRIGKPDEAMQQALAGLEIACSLGMRLDEASALTLMGLIALEQKDPTIAHKYLEDGLLISREIKNRRIEMYALNNLALSEGSVKGNYALAGEYFEQTYRIAKEIGDHYGEGFALANLGFAAGMQGNIPAAYSYHESSLKVARDIGNLNQEAYTLINLSALSGIQNDAAQALKFARQADALSRKILDRSAEAWSMLYMGHAYLLLRESAEAWDAYIKSIAIRDELNQPILALEPVAGLVEAALQMEDIELASQETEKILAYLDDGGSLDGTEEPLRIYYACYQFLVRQGDPRTRHVLQIANQLLETQVSNFKDVRSREMYVENFPWRRAIREAFIDTREQR